MQSHRRWLILAIVSSALFLIVVDVTVLYLALPHLTQDLGASATQKLWIVNAYALTVAGLLPGAGALADRFGYKCMFMSGLVVFGAASLCAAFSPSPQLLIGARVFLAIGAAMMMPATLAIIRHVFENPHERGVAIGIWAAIASGGAALGPVVGGLMLEYFWWGSVFLLNVPIICVAFLLAAVWIPASQPNPDRPFDLIASILIMIALVGLTYAIKAISAISPVLWQALVALAISALAAWSFASRQIRTGIVLIDFTLFNNRIFSAGAMTALVVCAALMGLELALSQRFQLVAELSPLQAGLAILPVPLAAFFAGPLSGHFLHRIGVHRMLWLSLAITGTGLIAYLPAMNSALWLQVPTFILIGAGIGAAMTAASSAMLLNAPTSQAGMAASIEEVSYEFGAALGIATLGSLLSVVYSKTLEIPGHAALDDSMIQSMRDSIDLATALASNSSSELANRILLASRKAFDRGFVTVLTICAVMLIASAVVIARCMRTDTYAKKGRPTGSI